MALGRFENVGKLVDELGRLVVVGALVEGLTEGLIVEGRPVGCLVAEVG
jgi:hypothetical protein